MAVNNGHIMASAATLNFPRIFQKDLFENYSDVIKKINNQDNSEHDNHIGQLIIILTGARKTPESKRVITHSANIDFKNNCRIIITIYDCFTCRDKKIPIVNS